MDTSTKQFLHPRLRRRGRKIVGVRGSRVCFELVPPWNIKIYIHGVLPTQLSKDELTKDSSIHANMDGERLWGLNLK